MMRMLTAIILALLLTVALCATAAAQEFDYTELKIEITPPKELLQPGTNAKLSIAITIPVGYTLSGESDLLAVKLMEKVEGFAFGSLLLPEAHFTDQLGGHYVNSVTVQLPVTAAPGLAPGEYEFTFGFVLQVCEINGICYFPTEAKDLTRAVTLEVGP
jgi:hypothetical protein